MGDKVTLSPLAVEDNSSYESGLNSRLDTLADEFDNVVYRDGTQDLTGNLNANSKRIYNLAAPVSLDDALRLRDLLSSLGESDVSLQTLLQSAAGASMIGYAANGASAVARTVLDKFDDGRVSVADYIPVSLWEGMKNGTKVDVTDYIQLALDACEEGSTLYFPFCLSGYEVSNPSGSAEKIFTVPESVHVYCEDGAWIYPKTDNLITTVFTPMGKNKFRINVDGRSLPEANDVGEEPAQDRSRVSEGGLISTWINYSFAIRAYATADLGFGAADVVVQDSQFRNLHHAIQTQGCSGWNISHNRFERIELAAVWFSYLGGNSTNNSVMNNFFREIGDMACTWVSQGEEAFGAYNNKMNFNTAIDTQLNTYGFAFNVEPGGSSTSTIDEARDLQHHFQIIGNTVEQIYHASRPNWCYAGGVTLLNCGESIIAHNIIIGALNSTLENGISAPGCRGLRIHNNQTFNFLGSGIFADGCIDSDIVSNTVRNCGGTNASVNGAIIIAGEYSYNGVSVTSHRVKVKGNRIIYTADFTHANEGGAGIAARAASGPCSDFVIEDNEITSPWGVGLYLNGNVFGNRIADVSLRNNKIERTVFVSAGWGYPVLIAGIDQLTIDGTIQKNCKFGYIVQVCTTVLIKNGEQQGTAIWDQAYNFDGCTGVRIENMRAPAGATTIIGGTAGTNVTHWQDELLAPTSYADNAAATAAGVPLHAPYWNGTAVAIRV